MKYEIIKELPFIKVGEIFGTGTWGGGEFGIDMGETHYESGNSAHNGVRTFSPAENQILKQLITNNSDWIKKIPETKHEVLEMFKKGELTELHCLDKLYDFFKMIK